MPQRANVLRVKPERTVTKNFPIPRVHEQFITYQANVVRQVSTPGMGVEDGRAYLSRAERYGPLANREQRLASAANLVND